ncbi:hypothetical protein [Shinella zoogloeoides]|uniref:hypothetical protein n=1 Tax=Shinella zoogloeoides TaxID=352475 RepID=UPI00273D79AD|nr:hypothetical protein [Shinella zoogloeoides]WLR90930.1 hypothetical protein Q9316_00705 [Shinella zoogloeoides]
MANSVDVPSLFDTLTPKPRTDAPLVVDGDCGIILKLDGRVEVFSTGIYSLMDDPVKWGERELAQLEIGKKLMAISVALQNEQIMSILYDIAEGVIDPDQARNVLKH